MTPLLSEAPSVRAEPSCDAGGGRQTSGCTFMTSTCRDDVTEGEVWHGVEAPPGPRFSSLARRHLHLGGFSETPRVLGGQERSANPQEADSW